MKNKPLLITGIHRSGSTWLGKVIASHPKYRYIHEPFNCNQPRCRKCDLKFTEWFTYVDSGSSIKYKNHIQHILNYKFFPDLISDFKYASARKFLTQKKDSFIGKNSKTPLIKDPIAFFSAEWLAKTFDMNVIVLIRHPAAFAGSLKKANWDFPFEHFLNQKKLMQKYLLPFKREISDYSKEKKDIVDQAILLWRIFYATVLKYQVKHPKWIFVRHEDLVKNPNKEYKKIFNKLDLSFHPRVGQKIEELSRPSKNLVFKLFRKNKLKRNPQKILMSWQKRLTKNEIQRVKEKNRDIWPSFYSEDSWFGN